MSFFKKKDLMVGNMDMGDVMVLKATLENVKNDVVVQVIENTEAIVMLNGAIYDVFQPGRSVVSIGRREKREKNAQVDICYVNKTVRINLSWATLQKIDFVDAETQIPVSLGASGNVTVEINNALQVFRRGMGTAQYIDTEKLKEFVKHNISVEAKDILARKLIEEGLGFYKLSKETKSIALEVKGELTSKFAEYGLNVVDFSIAYLSYPEEIKEMMQKYGKENYELKLKGSSIVEQYREKQQSEKIKAEREYDLAKQEHSNNIEREEITKTINQLVAANANKVNRTQGVPLQVQDNKLNTSAVVCPKCGARQVQGSIFCAKCGEKL